MKYFILFVNSTAAPLRNLTDAAWWTKGCWFEFFVVMGSGKRSQKQKWKQRTLVHKDQREEETL